jgi:hypothetical protein
MMKKLLSGPGCFVISVILLAGIGGPLNPVQAQAAKISNDARITVLSPLGQPPAIQLQAMAPRLKSLDGKTVYIVDDGYVGGDVLLKEIIAWFDRNMPTVHAVYRRKAGGFPDEDPALWAEIKEKGDAMIMGMGH